jgi:hypothetical protein
MGFSWLRFGSIVGYWDDRNEYSGCTERIELLKQLICCYCINESALWSYTVPLDVAGKCVGRLSISRAGSVSPRVN